MVAGEHPFVTIDSDSWRSFCISGADLSDIQLCQEGWANMSSAHHLFLHFPNPERCRRSCVNQGYFEDDFVRYFVRRPKRRPPIINRGSISCAILRTTSRAPSAGMAT